MEQSGEKNIDGIAGNNARKKTNNKWFETQDSIAYWDDFSKHKIIWTDIATEPTFVFVEEEIYFNNTCYMLVNPPKYLVGILDSKIIEWYFPKIATDLGNAGTRYFKQFVELIPVPKVNSNVEKKIVQCIEENKQQKIDDIVYRLYNLTEKEIEYIETCNSI